MPTSRPGSTQRFGVPLGFGGPHAGYLAARSWPRTSAARAPGRRIGRRRGASRLPAGAADPRAAHPAREGDEQHLHGSGAARRDRQHVRRLPRPRRPAVDRRAGAPLRRRSSRAGLREAGIDVDDVAFFDTITARVPGRADEVVAAAREAGVNLRLVDADTVGIACDEVTDRRAPGGGVGGLRARAAGRRTSSGSTTPRPATVGASADASPYLTHPVFSTHRSETAMLRYLRRLADRDYALDRGMIPLGFVHDEAQRHHRDGAGDQPRASPTSIRSRRRSSSTATPQLFADLRAWLAEITGYDAVSLQPNAGSQGEFAGLLAIRAYHRAHGDDSRTVCLIPASAHGTNAASAVMAGMRVVVVKTGGDAGRDRPRRPAGQDRRARRRLAAVMVTYPSTHGVFEEHIGEVCALVHEAGGQVYVDGANLNAMVGLARPGKFGADVSHLNLHKTFCIPHGGGGPGVGPIGVRAHLAPYLPNHPLQPAAGPATGSGAIAAAPWGSASILPITWAYIRMMGGDGLDRRDRRRHPVGQLRGPAPAGPLPGAVHRRGRPGRARVHPRPARDHPEHRRHRRRRRQAADRLRLPRADDVVPGRRHADGRADRVRGSARTRPVHRRP